MKHDYTDSNRLELAALHWFERLKATDVDEATREAYRHWLEKPANAEAYARVEQVFALARALADSPEMAHLSEETNRRIANRQIAGYTQRAPDTRRNPNRTETQSEKSK